MDVSTTDCTAIIRKAMTRCCVWATGLFCVSTDDNHNSFPFGDPSVIPSVDSP